MVKYFCDICGKEMSRQDQGRIRVRRGRVSVEIMTGLDNSPGASAAADGANPMTPHHNIATTPPPAAVWLQVYWWGENRWITARFDGANWRDELGRIVQGPIVYWREVT